MNEAPVEAVGPYRLESLLGKGGMGEVYRAFDERLGRSVAVKHMRPEVAGDPEVRARFQREAQAAAQLGHPAIAQVFDILEHAGDAWIVMELVDGPTLAELVCDGPLDVGLALSYVRQIVSALAEAHARGIIHRDLKTQNVMVLPSGHVKVLDFGLAKQRSPDDSLAEHSRVEHSQVKHSQVGPPRRSHRLLGTPRAMSPEQARGLAVDARSDLFSLGVLLYELLTARSPFRARTVEATLERVQRHRQPPARRLNPRIPAGLSELIDLLLAKDPAGRPAGAEAVARVLAQIVEANPLLRLAPQGASEGTTQGTVGEGKGSPPDDVPTLGRSSVGRLSDGALSGDRLPEDVAVKTLLLSDLVGSTRLVESLGDREAATLFQRHDRMARDLLAEHSGREIDKTDGFLLLFDRPWNAVRYAIAYHQGLRRLASGVGIALASRVGIHLGEVILHHNPPEDVSRGAKPLEVEGLAKPTAARLMSLAGGTQTLLTRGAYDVARRGAVGSGPGQTPATLDDSLRWMSHGSYRFRGIAEDLEVFEVGVPGEAPLSAPEGSAKVVPVDSRRATPAEPTAATDDEAPLRLRRWSMPELPRRPYPLLLPYTHPALLAGRERELTKLRQLLALPIPILGFYAASGVGKSSLLLGGLVPALRQEGLPVAVVRHPREAGVAERLLGDLIDGGGAPPESLAAGATVPWRRFVDRLNEVERLAGTAPVLVLDQLEDVLHHEAGAARTALGALLAATAQRRSGIESPPCRWLLAYRQEFHGEVLAWLRDVLVDAASAGVDDLEMLPHDLSTADRFHSLPLPPLATPTPGGDALADATLLFRAAIETPLAITAPDGSPRYSWHVTHDGAARLAGAFAEARIARPEAPLTPELQVVLADLLSRADDGRIEVPEEPADLIARALEDHLRRALESAFPAAVGAAEQARVGVSRARALLALGELAEAYRARQEGLPIETLSRAIGGEDGAETGERVLARLASPLTRLIVLQEHPTGWRYVLSHDRMAEVVVRAVEAEGQRGRLSVDVEILRLRRFVALETALFRSSQQPPPRLSRHRFRRIEAHAEALLWDADRRAWFLACRERRRVDLRRAVVGSLVSAVVLVVLAYGAWSWTTAWAARRSLLEQVAQGEPEAALLALEQAHGQAIGNNELLAALRQRTVPSAVLELGLGSLAGAQRSAAVLATVELMLPLVAEAPDDPVRIANLVWALDFAPQQDPSFTARARQLRARVLAPLRRLRPPPPLPGEGDSAWVDIPGGSFLMGIADDEEGPPQERPQHRVTVSAFRLLRHEVTVGEFRRLVPDHQGDEGLPVVGVTWYQAVTYAAWLGGRLPTEAEWEYAARAGCAYAYCDRQGRETTVDAVAWTPDNARTEGGESAPRPVMGLAANPWGLYDMLGNVSEWAGDWVGLYGAEKQSDPWGPAVSAIDGSWRIHRGGGVRNEVDAGIRSTRRSRAAPDFLLEDLGLRVVLPTGPAEGSTDDH